MDRDDLTALSRRYATRLTSHNQRDAYQLATAATLDVPRLIAAVQEAQAERDVAVLERDALRAEVAQLQAQRALITEPLSSESPVSGRRWSLTRAWFRRPHVPSA